MRMTEYFGLTWWALWIVATLLTAVFSKQYEEYQQELQESIRSECAAAPPGADGRQQTCLAAAGGGYGPEQVEEAAVQPRSLFLLSKLLGWARPSEHRSNVNVNVNVQQKSRSPEKGKAPDASGPLTVDVPVVLPAAEPLPAGLYGTGGAVCTNCYGTAGK